MLSVDKEFSMCNKANGRKGRFCRISMNRKQRWKKWLRQDIVSEIRYLTKLEIVNKKLSEIFEMSESCPKKSYFYWYIRHVHSASVAAGFYRLIDIRRDVISLKKLLHEVRQAPELVSRRAYTRLPMKARNAIDQKLEKQHLNEEFTKMAGSGQYVDPEIVSRDIKRIENISKKIEKFRHKFIGHHAYNQKRHKIAPTFEEAYGCVQQLTEIFKKYHLLITQSDIDVIADWEKQNIENDLASFFKSNNDVRSGEKFC